MVSGAVIVGRSIGPSQEMRPFTVMDFNDLERKCGFRLVGNCPVQVAYPNCLQENSGLEYQEGVLVNVFGGLDVKDDNDFEQYIEEQLITAAKMAEKIWCEYAQRGYDRPWQSDLHYQKVCWTGIEKDVGGIVWKPYMEILETYPEEEIKVKYVQIASDLVSKTKEARINRYKKIQERIDLDAIRRICEIEKSNL